MKKHSLLLGLAGALAFSVPSIASADIVTVGYGAAFSAAVDNFNGLSSGITSPATYSNLVNATYVGATGGIQSNTLGADKSWHAITPNFTFTTPFAEGYTELSGASNPYFTQLSVSVGQVIIDQTDLFPIDLDWRGTLDDGSTVEGRLTGLDFYVLKNVNFQANDGFYFTKIALKAVYHIDNPGFNAGPNHWDGLVADKAWVNDPLFIPRDPIPTVPEPSTWALMILGFGLTGSMLRSRRAQPVPATA